MFDTRTRLFFFCLPKSGGSRRLRLRNTASSSNHIGTGNKVDAFGDQHWGAEFSLLTPALNRKSKLNVYFWLANAPNRTAVASQCLWQLKGTGTSLISPCWRASPFSLFFKEAKHFPSVVHSLPGQDSLSLQKHLTDSNTKQGAALGSSKSFMLDIGRELTIIMN